MGEKLFLATIKYSKRSGEKYKTQKLSDIARNFKGRNIDYENLLFSTIFNDNFLALEFARHAAYLDFGRITVYFPLAWDWDLLDQLRR